MEEADGGALFEGAGLKECGGEGVGEAVGEIVEARFGVCYAAANAQ